MKKHNIICTLICCTVLLLSRAAAAGSDCPSQIGDWCSQGYAVAWLPGTADPVFMPFTKISHTTDQQGCYFAGTVETLFPPGIPDCNFTGVITDRKSSLVTTCDSEIKVKFIKFREGQVVKKNIVVSRYLDNSAIVTARGTNTRMEPGMVCLPPPMPPPAQ